MAVKYLDAKRLQGLSTDITATLGYNEPDAGNENVTLIANYAGGKTHRGQIWTTGHAMIGVKPQKVVVTLKKRRYNKIKCREMGKVSKNTNG